MSLPTTATSSDARATIGPSALEWPRGFRAAVGGAAIKKAGRDDLALLFMPSGAAAAAIFTRNLKDLRNNRAGFPDLVHFPADGGYCLIEVKGPGDSLQQNQQRWMQHFEAHRIPHRLARVSWCQN